MEKVQRQVTKLVPALTNLPCETRFRELEIYSLYHRKQCGNMIETYNQPSIPDQRPPFETL